MWLKDDARAELKAPTMVVLRVRLKAEMKGVWRETRVRMRERKRERG